MSASLPAFRPASELPPSPTREAELEGLCSRQAEQIERLREAAEQPAPQQARPVQAGIKPEAQSGRLNELEAQCKSLSKDIERLRKENCDLNKALNEAQQDILWIQESFPKLIAEDRKRLVVMEERITVAPQKKQIRNGEVLMALLVANSGKMLAVDARHKLGISKPAFSLLLRTLSDKVELKHFHLDRRKNVIILK